MNIKDKVAVITGAASGIARAICAELIKNDIKAIAMVDFSDAVIEAAAEINEIAGREIGIAFQGDVTSTEFRKRVFDEITKSHGRPSICVPAAGITRDALAVSVNKENGEAALYSEDDFRQVLEVNLMAPVYWALETIGHVAEERSSKGLKKWNPDEGMQAAVIFIGSISSEGIKGQISYSSTKAGLEGAAATLTKEAIFHGVRCGVIHPGFTDTPMVQVLGDEYLNKHILPYTQLGRLIRPQEIADAICFMIRNSAISGELWADAGWHGTAA